MWSEGKTLCGQESRLERAERMVTGGGEGATPSVGKKDIGSEDRWSR